MRKALGTQQFGIGSAVAENFDIPAFEFCSSSPMRLSYESGWNPLDVLKDLGAL